MIWYDAISLSDLESDQYQSSNLDRLESESSAIQFGSPNGLSLDSRCHKAKKR